MQEWTHASSETMIVVADLQCNFIKQIYFDEQLKVYVKAGSVGNSSLDLHYMVKNAKRRGLFSRSWNDGSSVEKQEEANHGLKNGRRNYYNNRVKENKRAICSLIFCLPSLLLMLSDVYIGM